MGPGPFWPVLPPLPHAVPPWAVPPSPGVEKQVLGSAPKIWGPGKGLCLASGHFLSQADIDQLKRIMEVVGTPSPEVLAKISSEHVSHQPLAPSADQAPRHPGGRGSVGTDPAPCGERGSHSELESRAGA